MLLPAQFATVHGEETSSMPIRFDGGSDCGESDYPSGE
jgi:hypothetical protein